MIPDRAFNVLFLCTHNSARSIMAEVILNSAGRGKFKGYSAGSQPATAPNPFALATLRRMHFPINGLHSKDWSEFGKPAAPVMDFVLTVCDNAAGEVCPVWPGQPITAHWGVEDPSPFQGTDEEKEREFARVAHILKRRIELFVSLPLDTLDRIKLAQRVSDLGKR
jgi:arsenate reductase